MLVLAQCYLVTLYCSRILNLKEFIFKITFSRRLSCNVVNFPSYELKTEVRTNVNLHFSLFLIPLIIDRPRGYFWSLPTVLRWPV